MFESTTESTKEWRVAKAKREVSAASGDNEALDRLADGVEKAIATIRQLRAERDELKRTLDQMKASGSEADDLRQELESFQAEREEARDRVEKILAKLESIDEMPEE